MDIQEKKRIAEDLKGRLEKSTIVILTDYKGKVLFHNPAADELLGFPEFRSVHEIHEITGVNLGTVKSRLHRARHSFAQRIEPHLN